MIIVKLMGGLGNQMFQYALGKNLSIFHGVQFKIDSSYLRSFNQSERTFKLDAFQTNITEATTTEIKKYQNTIQKILDNFRLNSKKKNILEQSPLYNPHVLNYSDGYFDGHWNSEKYFSANEEIIKNDFRLKKPLGETANIVSRKILSEPQSVSIHIRRGDYVLIKKIADRHGVLPLSYYEQAIDKITEKIPNPIFFVFSDDIEWVKKNFPKAYPVFFVSSPEITDCEELILMSLCKYNIIANSTFSWWSAWLNQNPEKIVISPKKWFLDSSISIEDLIPSSWLQI